jgi:hypothetical protein
MPKITRQHGSSLTQPPNALQDSALTSCLQLARGKDGPGFFPSYSPRYHTTTMPMLCRHCCMGDQSRPTQILRRGWLSNLIWPWTTVLHLLDWTMRIFSAMIWRKQDSVVCYLLARQHCDRPERGISSLRKNITGKGGKSSYPRLASKRPLNPTRAPTRGTTNRASCIPSKKSMVQ